MSSFVLKVIGCISMLIDHIGFAFFPKITILRVIGRLAFPIFAFQASVSYEKTKNKEKYILRMLLFTIVSQLPFYLIRKVAISNPSFMLNIGATITCGLLAIYCMDKIKPASLKYLCTGCILLLSFYIPMDYSWLGVCSIFTFYLFRKDKYGMCIFYSVLLISSCIIKNSIFNLPALYALLPIFLYNGAKGKNVKYFF